MDAPFEPLISDSTTAPPPPPPPNPQKDLILHQIAAKLYSLAQGQSAKTSTALQQTKTQQQSIVSATASLKGEIATLSRLGDDCVFNQSVLQEKIIQADNVIREAKERPLPEIDGLVSATTIVHEQLYKLVSEDLALGEAVWVLGRVLDGRSAKGREGGKEEVEEVVKRVRGLAREQFLKRMLGGRIRKGIGLEV